MKVNIGCGTDYREGWINTDIRPLPKLEIIMDLEGGIPIRTNTATHIELKDILEHCTYHKAEQILNEVTRIAKRGATIYIQCPDMEVIARKVILNPQNTWRELSYWTYGAQDYPENLHKTGFRQRDLLDLMLKRGFRPIYLKNDGGTNIISLWRKTK